MSAPTVQISEASHQVLKELAKQTGQTMMDVLDKALHAYGGAGAGPDSDRSRLPRETPVKPWNHLVARRHPWRKQLFLKGRNMTVRQLVGTVKANKLSEEQAANDLGLPVEAIREAFAYFDANPEVIELDAAYERYLRKLRGVGRGPQPVPR
jgi:uncharacterized protein (DUF433 family)